MTVTVQQPTYGYQLDEGIDRITLTISERDSPKFAGMAALGCAHVFNGSFLLLIGIVIGAAIGGIFGAFLGSLIMVLPNFLIIKYDKRRADDKYKNPHLYSQAIIGIERQLILINETAYDRAHVTAWTTRWTEATGGSFVATGSAAHMIAASVGSRIGNENAQKKAQQSYRITFDYGDQQIMAVGGLTEASANHIMNAIQTALSKMN